MQLNLFHRNKRSKTDNELLEFYLETRNPEFLGELYGRFIHLVYGVCLNYFRNSEKSKDAVMEIYENLQAEIWKHDVKNFKSWLYVVTKNHCLMELRKRKPGETIFISDENELDSFMENEYDLHPLDEDPDEFREKGLNECIEKLKNEQKMCIHLFYFKNKSYREIADVLKLEEKKVKSHIQNGKRNLKICLEGKE
ncbi:MAG: RNA polymerase sigma factor [Prolixibacteraceae bacterium]